VADPLLERLRHAVAGTPLQASFDIYTEPLRMSGLCAKPSAVLEPALTYGLARALASQADTARYLVRRPALLERILESPADAIETRELELDRLPPTAPLDLELMLDELRYLRRDETLFAACYDFSGLYGFNAISGFLSSLARACVRRAVEITSLQHPNASEWVVIGIGNVAGRELSYHSDLDLLFLYPDARSRADGVARSAQQLIVYLSTLTSAGMAYRVDSRLRPSGRQGVLVSSFDSYVQYQLESAATWEHLALMRTRELAGAETLGRRLLESLRSRLLTSPRPSWPEIDRMRRKIEQERGARRVNAFKTGCGGLMDVEFLATGALLECGPPSGIPSVPNLLRHYASGSTVEQLIADYTFLRCVEARARWVTGRAVEFFDFDRPDAEIVAELVQPGSEPTTLRQEVDGARSQIRTAYDAVISAGTIRALGPLDPSQHPPQTGHASRPRRQPSPWPRRLR